MKRILQMPLRCYCWIRQTAIVGGGEQNLHYWYRLMKRGPPRGARYRSLQIRLTRKVSFASWSRSEQAARFTGALYNTLFTEDGVRTGCAGKRFPQLPVGFD